MAELKRIEASERLEREPGREWGGSHKF